MASQVKWRNETDVDDYVKRQLESLRLEKNKDYLEKGASESLKKALEGYSKTKSKTGKGIPDFTLENYNIPVLIESKFELKKLEAKKDGYIKFDDDSIAKFAFNGALHYARGVVAKYKEAIAIGIAGDSEDNVSFKVAYVFGDSQFAIKPLNIKSFDFLESKESFDSFYKEAILNEEDKHRILIDSQEVFRRHTKILNKLMHNHHITAPQRVLYISGMLLAMQNILQEKGLRVESLTGSQLDSKRDSLLVYNQIEEFLKIKVTDERKRNLMLKIFERISIDIDRDKPKNLDKAVVGIIAKKASITKQIFAYLYEYIYSEIDAFKGHLDIMGEMYSEFLKYALGDGKELGIVLTPPYVTKMMSKILKINKDSKVMDLATGSAGFLISAMVLMIEDAENTYGKDTTRTKEKIQSIKANQLLGVEYNDEMFALATANMILRGDGSSKIEKGDSFEAPKELYENFKANRVLLNPPFTYKENGMPFIKLGLDNMEKGGLGAIIIQDSAGSGKAIRTNQEILRKHTLKASIKMPNDLFLPMAGVQTSIYIFEAHTPHDFDAVVRFIDFRNDGFKRTIKGIKDIDHAEARYSDIVEIYKNGLAAKVKAPWDLEACVIDDYITNGAKTGTDWNFDQHQKIDTKPTLEDFKKCVSEYLAWEVSNVLKNNKARSGEL